MQFNSHENMDNHMHAHSHLYIKHQTHTKK